jgi:hypothetical protein
MLARAYEQRDASPAAAVDAHSPSVVAASVGSDAILVVPSCQCIVTRNDG